MLNFKPETVLFDLDGTLLDTAPDFVRVVNLQRKLHSLAPLPPENIRATVSNGAKALIKLAFDLDEQDQAFTSRHAELLDLYAETIAEETVLFPGIELLLKQLEGSSIPWGIVTNKPSRFTLPLLDRLNLSERCGITVCPDDVANSKPDPESLFLACKKLTCEPSRSIYVGDHLRDIQAGKNAGMATVAARYGYVDNPNVVNDWHADFIIDHGDELTQWLKDIG